MAGKSELGVQGHMNRGLQRLRGAVLKVWGGELVK